MTAGDAPSDRPRSAWLRQFHRSATGGPLVVCIPHAGGWASTYYPLSGALSAAATVLIVQYPGRHERVGEACVEDVGLLADHVADSLSAWDGHSVVLFGHSMGAAVAYETILRLELRSTAATAGLIVSGRVAPSIRVDRGMHRRDDAGLLAELAELSGADPRVLADRELRELVLRTLRSDLRAAETYRAVPGTTVTCPISAYSGTRDALVPLAGLGRWAEHTTSSCTTRQFPGGHFYLRYREDAVAAAILDDVAVFTERAV